MNKEAWNKKSDNSQLFQIWDDLDRETGQLIKSNGT